MESNLIDFFTVFYFFCYSSRNLFCCFGSFKHDFKLQKKKKKSWKLCRRNFFFLFHDLFVYFNSFKLSPIPYLFHYNYYNSFQSKADRYTFRQYIVVVRLDDGFCSSLGVSVTRKSVNKMFWFSFKDHNLFGYCFGAERWNLWEIFIYSRWIFFQPLSLLSLKPVEFEINYHEGFKISKLERRNWSIVIVSGKNFGHKLRREKFVANHQSPVTRQKVYK